MYRCLPSHAEGKLERASEEREVHRVSNRERERGSGKSECKDGTSIASKKEGKGTSASLCILSVSLLFVVLFRGGGCTL